MALSNGQTFTDDERKERRRAANRRSARKSRYRESVITNELQKSIVNLVKQNDELRAANEAIRQEVAALQSIMDSRKTQQSPTVRFKRLTIPPIFVDRFLITSFI